MKTILSGATIGILGGGQLGRMTALAAAKLGYHTHVFCPDANEPAVEVSTHHTKADFWDKAALTAFAKSVDVITLEWENVPVEAIEHLAAITPVHPSAAVLKVAQDRLAEKNFARDLGVGTAEFMAIDSEAELARAMEKFSLPAILKSNRMGYDGKGQVKITRETNPADAWKQIGGVPSILEAFVDFVCEVSVIVACRADGASAAYPVVENIHRNHILAETHAPAGIDHAVAEESQHVARRIAEKLGVVGLLAVEMFVLRAPDKNGHRVLMNEVAPRPHNSGHWTMDACACSQFEQLVRAVCGLPLGDTTPHSRAVMQNLIGDDIALAQKALQESSASVHLYGKNEVRAGRKMGHITRLGGAW